MATYNTDNYNPVYADAGCPSQCMSTNTYAPLGPQEQCSAICLSEYADPSLKANCPSSCNFFSTYSTLPNYYAGSTLEMPSTTASRLIPQAALLTDYQVVNPRISNFKGSVAKPRPLADTPLSSIRDAGGVYGYAASQQQPIPQTVIKAEGVVKQAPQAQMAKAAIDVAKKAEVAARVATVAAQKSAAPEAKKAAAVAQKAAAQAKVAAKAVVAQATTNTGMAGKAAAALAKSAATVAKATEAAVKTVPQGARVAAKATTSLGKSVQTLGATTQKFYEPYGETGIGEYYGETGIGEY